MIKFENTRVYNFLGAMRGMRNSWGSHGKLDSYNDGYLSLIRPENAECFVLGENDKALALKLILADGNSHSKFLRQILVSVDITAGSEWWRHADTYKVGVTTNSTSAMHVLGKRLLTADDFSFDKPLSYIAKMQIDAANLAIEQWWESGKKNGSKEWRDMQKAIPMGFIYSRHTTLNYQVLRAMYFDRKNHRLAEWQDFCKWVESLPYSELITARKTKK